MSREATSGSTHCSATSMCSPKSRLAGPSRILTGMSSRTAREMLAFPICSILPPHRRSDIWRLCSRPVSRWFTAISPTPTTITSPAVVPSAPARADTCNSLPHTTDKAFGKFFDRLQKDGITKYNTLFVITADENDHFVGGAPSPADYDGIEVPCTCAKKGEINADLSNVIFTEFGDTTPFTVHSDDAPTFYITGNPAQTASVTRTLEREA